MKTFNVLIEDCEYDINKLPQDIKERYTENEKKINNITRNILFNYDKVIYDIFLIYTNPKIEISNNTDNMQNIFNKNFRDNVYYVLNEMKKEFPNIRVYDHYTIIDEIKEIYAKGNIGNMGTIESESDLIEKFKSYEKSYLKFSRAQGITESTIDYKKLYNNLQKNDKQKMFKTLDNVLYEQKKYFEKKIYNTSNNYGDYNTWIIIAYLNDEPYGAVFLFQNKKNKQIYRFQGIAKYYEAIIFSLLHPKHKLISINELLIPFIEEFVKKIGGKKIYVNPIGIQYETLIKKYNFKRIGKIYNSWNDFISNFGGIPVVKSI